MGGEIMKFEGQNQEMLGAVMKEIKSLRCYVED